MGNGDAEGVPGCDLRMENDGIEWVPGVIHPDGMAGGFRMRCVRREWRRAFGCDEFGRRLNEKRMGDELDKMRKMME